MFVGCINTCRLLNSDVPVVINLLCTKVLCGTLDSTALNVIFELEIFPNTRLH